MSLRFPVAVWQDAEGSITATTLDGPEAAVIDRSVGSALAQLKKHLIWSIRQGELVGTPDFDELELRDHRVWLRPKYVTAESVFPAHAAWPMRVAAVHGHRRDGALHCVLPTLGIRFTYQSADLVDELLTEAVQHALGDKTPQELSRELMPDKIALHAVHVPQRRGSPQSSTEAATPALASVADKLDRRGGRFARAWLRDREVRELVEQLSGGQANLLLLGSTGVGKTTVLMAAISECLRRAGKGQTGDSDDRRSPRCFWRASGQRLIAGMRYLGQWEERCENVIAELGESSSVLCVESLLELVRVGGCEPGGSVAAFLMPYLERRELRLVAEATPTELAACRRLLPGFVELFQIVRLPEFSAAAARELLDQLLNAGQQTHKLQLEAGLAGLIYRLFQRFQPYAAFPGRSAIFVRHWLDAAAHQKSTVLTQGGMLARFQQETGLPEHLLRDDMILPHEQVLHDFRAAVLGQPQACQAAAAVVSSLKTGLNDPRRPLGVLLFCGPTGVGKTEMAKALARYLFGAGGATDRLVRLDMNEYSGFGAAQRLVTAADGDVSEFIKRMRQQPFAVVLLDEIEKAAAEVHDALLGVLDEGRLTDRFGRTTSFLSAVIVMTSNLGAERSAPLGFENSAQPAFERIAMGSFRPEFFNRIDAVVTFQPLDHATIVALAERELLAIGHREGLAKAGLRLHWSPAVIERVAATGFDARYGARPLLRAIEREVIAPLSAWLLANPGIRQQELILEVDKAGIVVRARR